MTNAFTVAGSVGDTQDEHGRVAFVAKQLMNGMATATLVQVKAVEGRNLDAQPMVHRVDGAGNGLPHGTIHSMPWFSLRAGASEIRATPKPGDIGLAVFCHNDTSSVKATGAPANPASRRKFDWADGVYLGGLLGSAATQWITVDDDAGIEIKSAVAIKLTGPVQIDGALTVTGSVTASGDVTAQGKSLATHTHGGVTAGGGKTGTPS